MAYISKRKKLYFVTFISIAVVCAAIALFVIYVMPKMAIVKFVDGTVNSDAEIAESITLEKGAVLPEELPSPTKKGYTFDFWYHSKQFNINVKVKPGVDIIEEDTTLYANFIPNVYTITFHRNGATGITPSPITQEYGTKVTLPTDAGLTMTDKVLYGWSLKADGTAVAEQPGSQIYMYADNVTLYAIWGDPKTTLNYVVGDDSVYLNPEIYFANQPMPADAYKEPYRPGYIFEGWYTDETYTTPVVFGEGGTMLTVGNMSIYAKYRPVEYTLTYKIYNEQTSMWEVWEHNGTPQVFTIYHDGTIEEPSLIPTKVGRSFVHWCIDDSLLAPFVFEGYEVYGNVTLYAKWGDIAPVPDETAATAFNYEKNDSTQTVKITGVKDVNINALVIPRQIDGYDVVELGNGLANMPVLTVVKLPYTIRIIGESTFSGCPLIQKYEMLSESNYFKVESGVLYSADGKTLYRYPASKEGVNYTTLASATKVMPYAFDNAQYLQNVTINAKNVEKFAFKNSSINSLTFGSAVESIDKNAFRDFYQLATVVNNSSQYQVIDGGIYNANATELIKYFGKELNKSYTSVATLTTINSYAFDGCSNIVSITLSANVTTINAMAFSGCTSLTTLRLGAVNGYATNNVISGCTSLTTIYCHMAATNAIYTILQAAPEVASNPITFAQV